MKVRATRMGFYKGRHIDSGTVFEIKQEDIKTDFADVNSSDVRVKQFGWMEEVKEESFLHKIFSPKPVEEQRMEPRDQGEKDQREAEKQGLV